LLQRTVTPQPSEYASPMVSTGIVKALEFSPCRGLDFGEQKENNLRSESRVETTVGAEKRSAWLRQLDEECPHQVVLPRGQLTDDNEILDFLIKYVGKFDMYVEDDYAAFVRYCFEDPLDAEIFRARFEPKIDRFKLAG
jgi:hypothetical protein